MKTSSKIFFSFIAVILLGYAVYLFYKLAIGQYFVHASFINVFFILIGCALGLVFLFRWVKSIWLLFLSVVILQSCNYAKSNQQVVVSSDCGMTWELIKAGDAVPRGGVNMCYMKVVMPNFPMQGESKFISNLKDKVRASVHIDYDYSIIEPLAFIKQAKYLGKANVDADSEDTGSNKAFEGAENMVIDKRIKDVAKNLFITEDIVELDQSDLENKLLIDSNKVLEPLGIRLNFITLTFDLDEQTRQAIDISTAMKIYESKQISEVGKQVMVSRAGATKITVETRTESAQ
jgi:energy-coupling factor transporter transmembrane protein EcfT